MKPCILGSSSTALCQINDLRKGFSELGHTPILDPSDPDTSFVFVGNAPFDSYLNLTRVRKIIFNVLDLAPHCPEHPEIVVRLREQLPHAARVTTISQTVAHQLAEKCGVKAEVIYYPMKNVWATGDRKYPFRVLMAGRLRDPNKGAQMAINALIRAGFNEDEVAMVGPEYPGWGTDMGVVDGVVLNDLYNSVDYVVSMAREEGIGLVPCEGAICGAIPIVSPLLSTFNEFWVESPLGLNYRVLNTSQDVADLIRYFEDNPDQRALAKRDVREYANRVFRPKFDRREVARRIVEVYQGIA